MARNARKKSATGFYHVIIRGIGKQILFEDSEDYVRFRETMKRYLGEFQIQIHAYCMMDNHVHLLVHDLEDELDLFMKRLEGSYAFYYNHRYERIGSLFQNRYKSEPVEDDVYYTTVLRYILQNPQKAQIAPTDKYLWSSFSEIANEPDIIPAEIVASFFDSREALLRYVSEPCNDDCMEPSEPSINDNAAMQIIRECLHIESGTQIQSFEKNDRDEALCMLKQKGLSIRQIERLTGINRGVVLKA